MNVQTRLPDDAWADMQVEQALRVLADHHARQWEAGRPEREARARKMMADGLWHAECCEKRADAYLADAARFPAAHKDHAYYLRLANEQLAKAADARRCAEVEGRSL